MTKSMPMTAKKLHKFGLIYIYTLIIIGFWLAKPLPMALSLVFIGISVWQIKQYQKTPIPQTNLTFFWTIPYFCIMFLIFYGLSIFDNYAIERNQLQSISGVVPETSTYEKRTRYTSSYYLSIGGKGFHCQNIWNDDCDLVYQYKGQVATILYQPDIANGNLAYEIQIGNQRVYEFTKQRELFLAEQWKEKFKWVWTFLLLFFPSIWFDWQHRELRKSLPIMTDEEMKAYTQNQKQMYEQKREKGEHLGCLSFFFVLMLIIADLVLLFGILWAIPAGEIATAILFGVFFIVIIIGLYFLLKKQ